VKKLLLVSPIGVRVPPEGETWQQRYELRTKDGGGPPGFVKPMMNFFWNHHFSPFGPGRFMGQRQAKKLLAAYVRSRAQIKDDDEKEALVSFMYQIAMRPGTTEYAIHGLFSPAL
jgi:hypothetical protein